MRANKYTGTSKRGHKYNLRENKTANGFSKMMVDNNYSYGNIATATQKRRDMLRLAINGTLDELGGSKLGVVVSSQVEHPTDKGYFKRFYRLGKFGKSRLRRARNRKKKEK